MENGEALNTIVTIGDKHYIWGIFMLIASARKAGMREPFLVGAMDFPPEAGKVLEQFGDVALVHLGDTGRSLACMKAKLMMDAKTPFVTWADADAFFTGNVSEMLAPPSHEEARFRLRTPSEMPAAFKGHVFGEDGTHIPVAVLEQWQRDVAAVAGETLEKARYTTSGSSAFFSISLARHRRFLELWYELESRVLPVRNVGVVDDALKFYHQLDESTLNACLNFVKDAPLVKSPFGLNRDRKRLFAHFIAHPKPWEGWTKRALRFYDDYIGVLDWALAQGYAPPGPVPFSLKRRNGKLCRRLAPFVELAARIMRRLKRYARMACA